MKIFYHNDLDGVASAATAYYFLKDNTEITPYDFYIVNYSVPLNEYHVEKDETVYVLDYSLKAEELKWLLNVTGRVHIIDHHVSTKRMLESNTDLVKKLCTNGGYFFDSNHSATYNTYVDLSNDVSEIPYVIELVSLWDTWQHKTAENGRDAVRFKYGIEVEKNSFVPINDKLWVNLLEGDMELIDRIISSGESILRYLDNSYDAYRSKYGFETGIDNYITLVCNYKENSILFGYEYDDYEICCSYVYNGEKYIYSLYSSKPYVDCSRIAERFGGGGHKGAAGFTLDYNLFEGDLDNFNFNELEFVKLMRKDKDIYEHFIFEDENGNVINLSVQADKYFQCDRENAENLNKCKKYELALAVNHVHLSEEDDRYRDLLNGYESLDELMEYLDYNVFSYVPTMLVEDLFKFLSNKFTLVNR